MLGSRLTHPRIWAGAAGLVLFWSGFFMGGYQLSGPIKDLVFFLAVVSVLIGVVASTIGPRMFGRLGEG